MNKITNISAEAFQIFTIEAGDETGVLNLRYHSVAQMWTIDVTFRDVTITGKKLSLGVLHLENQNWPFDFLVDDTSTQGIDPFKNDDFQSGRIVLYQLTADELKIARGYDVEVL